MSKPFHIIEPKVKKVPLILSVPHCGTDFPEELTNDYVPEMMASPDDTDWFVHQLYNFASEMGITIIYAKYSRWVIDLNRDPESAPLYNDGRIITGLTTTTDFFGRAIYTSENKIPDQAEIERRLENYYWPYYAEVQSLLDARKEEFGKALLWDAHSIRHLVPTIRKDVFPDMILGNNDEKTAHKSLIKTTLTALTSSKYGVNHNTPFKGGHITRYFGKPENDIHALQLEMNKILYMDDTETKFETDRANAVRVVLKQTFSELIKTLETL
ncbi:MAG: N-formylglutamate amidohydrolase [Crocinitomicaceae bacterium]|nr:N-formylglutamate amidohydrolase [Crocinitomicaceae bacterium]MDG1776340.1 N-formylglutamate amidohydrolase [Crocinitomicaceae bacterium]